jgi:hypothetical protein
VKNSLFTIHPYQDGGVLAFDDASTGLVREALVGGTDLILKVMAKQAGANPDHFTLIFSAIPFPGYQAQAEWIDKGELGFGDVYRVTVPGLIDSEGWLCPALLKYFDQAPATIYFQIKPFERTPHV